MVTMTGPFGGALETLAILIADTTAFRTWTGAADQAAALEHVHFFSDLGSNFVFPAVLLEIAPGMRQEKVSESGGGDYGPWPRGAVRLTFLQTWDTDYAKTSVQEYDPEQAAKDFIQNIELTLTGMRTLSGTASYFSIGALTMTDVPKTSTPSQGENDLYLSSTWELEIG